MINSKKINNFRKRQCVTKNWLFRLHGMKKWLKEKSKALKTSIFYWYKLYNLSNANSINKPTKNFKNDQRQCVTFMLKHHFFGIIFNYVFILGNFFGYFVLIILGVSEKMKKQNKSPFLIGFLVSVTICHALTKVLWGALYPKILEKW